MKRGQSVYGVSCQQGSIFFEKRNLLSVHHMVEEALDFYGDSSPKSESHTHVMYPIANQRNVLILMP